MLRHRLLLLSVLACGCQLVADPDRLPAGLSYATNAAEYRVGEPIAPNAPSSLGAEVTGYEINPELPRGLSIDPRTGVISGTPVAVSPATTYQVTASNETGRTIAALTLSASAGSVAGMKDVAAAGANHTCAVADGRVLCWGANDKGQLGDGTRADSAFPVWAQGVDDVQAVTAGEAHTCALSNGGVWCWGDNEKGQLGDATTTERLHPVRVEGLGQGVQAIAAGRSHTCALANGGVWCWGDNGQGQLGNDTTRPSTTAVLVNGLEANVQLIAAGWAHTCAVAWGAAQCWGDNGRGQLGTGDGSEHHVPAAVAGPASAPAEPRTGITAIAAGAYHTCAISNGNLWCWGDNDQQQLGSRTPSWSDRPLLVAGALGAQSVATGASHTCAAIDGRAYCWGSPELGDGALGEGVQAVMAGGKHTCALVKGEVRCWGSNARGELGDGEQADHREAVRVTGFSAGLQAIAAGPSHTCAIVAGGVQCWGKNKLGQLGDGSPSDSRKPVEVKGLPAGAQAIAVGDGFSCALVNGGVWCWGGNEYGERGIPTSDDASPSRVTGLAAGVQAISAGAHYACALSNGSSRCWGFNGNSELGDPLTTDPYSTTPVQSIAAGVQLIAASWGQHTCAIVNGRTECWGAAGAGQLGYGGTTDMVSPYLVKSLNSTSGLTAGGLHTCAIVNGGAWCWGSSSSGQCGISGASYTRTPLPVMHLGANLRAITTGANFSCAIENGGVRCWGDNRKGQLGNDPDAINSSSPVGVVGLGARVQAFSAGYEHACAIANGKAYCWGANLSGQLGNDSTRDSWAAVPVVFP